MKIVVVGGTGLIGSKVVEALIARGHDAIAAARRSDRREVPLARRQRALDELPLLRQHQARLQVHASNRQ